MGSDTLYPHTQCPAANDFTRMEVVVANEHGLSNRHRHYSALCFFEGDRGDLPKELRYRGIPERLVSSVGHRAEPTDSEAWHAKSALMPNNRLLRPSTNPW